MVAADRMSFPIVGKQSICFPSYLTSLTFTMPTPDVAEFLLWFQSEGGYVDLSALDIVDFPLSEGGRGAITLRDIPVIRPSFSSSILETYYARKDIHFFRYHGH